MKKNWTLHILAHKCRVEGGRPTFTLGIHRDNETIGQSGAMPTVHHPSWQHLSVALAAVGVDESQLMELEAKLEAESACDIHVVHLDEADIQRLGFTAQQVPPSAFS